MDPITAILALIVALALGGGVIYNKLIKNRNMVEEGWSGIDVQLKRRANLIETVKGYMGHENDRLDALHPPEETPELFEKYLPYALAMGVENQWSENFAAVLAGAGQAAERGYRPIWSSGQSFHSHGVSGFGDNLGSSLSSALNTSSSAPGSSGGGGSGGGGGGRFLGWPRQSKSAVPPRRIASASGV